MHVNKQALSSLQCPSDGGSGPLVDYTRLGADVWMAKSNYLGLFCGLQDSDNYVSPIDQETRGFFRPYEGTKIAEISDGTSNTMAVAEYLKGMRDVDSRGGFYTNRAGRQFLYTTLGPNSNSPDVFIGVSGSVAAAFCSDENNAPEANLPCVTGDGNSDYASPRSRHPGGVNALFCDGSVHFMPDEIDITTWRCLGWIADGNALDINL